MNPGQAYSCPKILSLSNSIDSFLPIDLGKELLCFIKVCSIKLTREVAINAVITAFVEQPNSVTGSFTAASSSAGRF